MQAGTVGTVLPDVLLLDSLCGRTHPGFQAQRRVSVYVHPGDGLKNKCQKSRSLKCFLLLPGCAGPGPAVRLRLQMVSADEDLL